jgi:hypothetical protein
MKKTIISTVWQTPEVHVPKNHQQSLHLNLLSILRKSANSELQAHTHFRDIRQKSLDCIRSLGHGQNQKRILRCRPPLCGCKTLGVSFVATAQKCSRMGGSHLNKMGATQFPSSSCDSSVFSQHRKCQNGFLRSLNSFNYVSHPWTWSWSEEKKLSLTIGSIIWTKAVYKVHQIFLQQ